MIHGSIDIECLDVDPSSDAGVIAVGIVAFDRNEILESAQWVLDPIWTPGTRSESTHRWWQAQSIDIQTRMFSGEVLPWKFCSEFSSFLGLNGIKLLWGYPARYDIGHLRSLYRAFNAPFPVDFRAERDMTTLVEVVTDIYPHFSDVLDSIRERNTNAHEALADARNQAIRLQAIFKLMDLYV